MPFWPFSHVHLKMFQRPKTRAQISTFAINWTPFCVEDNHQWSELGLQPQPKDQTAVFIGGVGFFQAQERPSGQKQNVKHAHCFFFFSTLTVMYLINLSPMFILWVQSSTISPCNIWEWALSTNDPSCRVCFWPHNTIATYTPRPHSPDLASSDIFLSHKLKFKLKCHLFGIMEIMHQSSEKWDIQCRGDQGEDLEGDTSKIKIRYVFCFYRTNQRAFIL